ncbi:MAG: hypothetical protein AB7V62_11685 [Thermoleophilia bacterium]
MAALVGAALAAGIVVSVPAGGQGGGGDHAEYRDARSDLNRNLAAYRENVVYRVFDDRPATLRKMRGYVAGYDNAVTRLERLEESGDAPISDPLELHDLREAQTHMDDYLDAVLGNDQYRMQVSTWRFLWVLNRLPLGR